MQPLFEMKYRRPNVDWQNLPFQANGAGIAIYSTVLTTLVSTNALKAGPLAVIPAGLYFIGLLLSYATYATNLTLVGDIDQRERLNDGMEWLTAHEGQSDLTPELQTQMESLFALIKAQREMLLPTDKMRALQVRAAKSYGYSLLCFLLSTFTVFGYFTFYLASQS